MADGEFIEPPPWLTPPPTAAEQPQAEPAEPAEVIELPPGVTDSATHRLAPERQRTPPAKPDIVFFPVTPGVPVPHEAGAAAEDATVVSSGRHSATWRITVPGESPTAVYGVLYLGRNPVAPAGESGARVLAVPDTEKSVSKTHARLEVEGGQLYVSDLDSTNGVWVVASGADPVAVGPGTRVAIPAGSDLELGDLVIQVEHG